MTVGVRGGSEGERGRGGERASMQQDCAFTSAFVYTPLSLTNKGLAHFTLASGERQCIECQKH